MMLKDYTNNAGCNGKTSQSLTPCKHGLRQTGADAGAYTPHNNSCEQSFVGLPWLLHKQKAGGDGTLSNHKAMCRPETRRGTYQTQVHLGKKDQLEIQKPFFRPKPDCTQRHPCLLLLPAPPADE